MKQEPSSWIMQNIFTRADKKLLKGLKMEYFHWIMMKKKSKGLRIKKKKIRNKNGLIDYEKLQKLIDLKNPIEMILEVNRQQQEQGLKMLTPNQMLSRLPILLDQLKTENNSEKLGTILFFVKTKKFTKKTFTKVWLTLLKTWKQFLWTVKTVKQVNHTDLN